MTSVDFSPFQPAPKEPNIPSIKDPQWAQSPGGAERFDNGLRITEGTVFIVNHRDDKEA